MLQPHYCDLHTVKQPKEDIQPELEEAKHTVETKVIKKECYNSMWIEVDKCDEFVSADEEFSIYNHCVKLESKLVDDALCKVKIEPVASSSTVEQVYENQCTLKYESTTFGCTLCFEEFNHEHEYNKHMSLHVQAAADNDSCVVSQARDSSIVVGSRLLLLGDSSHVTEHKYPVQQLCEDSYQSTNLAQTSIASLTPRLSTNKEIKVLPSGKVSSLKSSRKKSETISKLKIASTEYHFQAASESDVIPDTIQNDSDCSINDINAQFYNSAHYIRPRTHTEEKCFICDFCQKKFKRKSLLVKHIMSHTGEKPYSCELCSYKSTRKYDLVRHMQTHTGEQPYSCNVCKYKFVRNSDLVYHMRTHTGEKPYYCKLCEYKCVKNSNLVRHMRTHTGEKPYSCMVCGYTCALKNSLVMHMRTHTGDKPYSCDLCDYKCAQNSNLVSHMRAHTSEKPLSCMLCEYKCALNSDLVKHVRTHTGEKPYSCELCEYKCALKYSLVLHMRTHTGVKPYSCKFCEYRSAHKNSVVLHMRTHTNKKPYSCELCEYKSAYKHSLVLHMRTHTGEKPYSCKLCDYKCAQNSNLVTHMRTHTGEKPDDS